MEKSVGSKWRISSFSIILIMVVITIVGAAIIPLLPLRYEPQTQQKGITVRFSWQGASARVIESNVTSKIEGMMASIKGVQDISSESYKNSAEISLTIKKGENIDAIRFEVASLVRQIYSSLPQGVTYPQLSLSTRGENSSPIITYTINSSLPTEKIERYVNDNIVVRLGEIKDVSGVSLYGATPFVWEVTFDHSKSNILGISGDNIAEKISTYFKSKEVIGQIENCNSEVISIEIGNGKNKKLEQSDFENIPVGKSDNKIIYLRDVAKVEYKQRLPETYFRINGLNTINLTVYADRYANTIDVVDKVKQEVEAIVKLLPKEYSIMLASDSTVYIKKELNKIYFRTVLSLIILLLFVLLVSRSFKYLLIIFFTLIVNLLVAVIFYYLFKVEIHIYSLAGITVSLGIVIDTAVIMADHFARYQNRKVFLSIFAALMTTIASLSIVFFLPESQQENLRDFSLIIIINLSVSLLIAWTFIPSLYAYLPIKSKETKFRIKQLRFLVHFYNIYLRFINFGRRHKLAAIVVAILSFGLPVFLLPSSLEDENKQKREDFWGKAYNSTIGSSLYQNKFKPFVDVALGGALRPFMMNVSETGGYRSVQRKTLRIIASMGEGCTVHQLNEVMKYMENYLSRFDEIETFQTRIYSYDYGFIEVTFKPEYENTMIPATIYGEVQQKAINYGGANWGIYGIDNQTFSNNVVSQYRNNSIVLKGYNYDRLYDYATQLKDSLHKNNRVSNSIIGGKMVRRNFVARNEYYINYDTEKFILYNINPQNYFTTISNLLYSRSLESVFDGEKMTQITLSSSELNSFDIWHLTSDMVRIDTTSVRLSNFANVDKLRMGNDIYKENQEYILTIGYDFVGSAQLSQRSQKKIVDKFNNTILPIGFKAEVQSYNWWNVEDKKQYLLLGLIVVIIFFTLAILFESLFKPIAIIVLIPLSFIGLFLTFYLGKFTFDQGGFASMVLLSGIVVNAGIYLSTEYDLLSQKLSGDATGLFIRAFRRKITPILITILSTVLGLVPFILDGKDEVFWFAFAVGAMGGILFSILALFIYLPIFIINSPRKIIVK